MSALFIGSASLAMNGLPAIAPMSDGREPAFASSEELCDAVQNGNVKQVKALLAAGVPVDSKNEYGNTPLKFAIMWGRKNICALLIDSRARIDAYDEYGETPMMLADRLGKTEMCVFIAHIMIKRIKQRAAILLGLKKFHKAPCMKSNDIQVIKLIIKFLVGSEKQKLFKQIDAGTFGNSIDNLHKHVARQLTIK